MTSSQNFEIRGQCLCGAVRFSGRAGGPEVTACHCGQCRRWSGHVWASFHLDAPVIDGEALRWYQSSPEAERGFCSVCGTSLFWRPNGRETLSVSPGAIENPTGLRMDEHIYVADKGDYYRIADGLPQQDQQTMIWETLANIPAAQLTAFIAGGLVLNFAPGQDVFFASACGIQGGPRAGALAGLGVGLGVLMHLTMATVGLGAVVAAHPQALLAIKYAGAAYLLWLAWKSWTAGPVDPSARGSVRPWNIIRRGFMSNALNPKPVLFLLAFLPQFTNPAWGPVWQQILGLGLIFAVTGTIVTMGYGIVGGLAGHVIGRNLGVVNKIAAVMFAGLALRLVTK